MMNKEFFILLFYKMMLAIILVCACKLRTCCPNKKCFVELILIFRFKPTEILSKQRGISVDAIACFRKMY
jgi:hypothetical protein